MQYVCNCNSFGNIDYGIPVTPYKLDYRTSTERAIKHLQMPDLQYFGIQDTVSGYGRPYLESKVDRYKSDIDKSFVAKPLKHGPRYPRPAMLCNMHYMRSVKEEMYKNPHKPMEFRIPEYKDKYTIPKLDVEQPFYNIDERTTCPVLSIGKAEQPRIRLEEMGVIKKLDPYISTTQMTYIPFTKDAVKFAREKPYTFYNSNEIPRLKRINIRKPVNDDTKFKLAIISRLVPKNVHRVPYTGDKSEFKDKFTAPNTGKLLIESKYHDVQFKDSLSEPNKRQVLAAPNMYCTDYCHIGTGRNVRCAINMIPPKYDHLSEHTGCKHDQ